MERKLCRMKRYVWQLCGVIFDDVIVDVFVGVDCTEVAQLGNRARWAHSCSPFVVWLLLVLLLAILLSLFAFCVMLFAFGMLLGCFWSTFKCY